MNRDSADARPWYFWPLIGLLAGILIGLIIGWGIWPVNWTNTYPRDLIAEERNEYLAMVAESYATNRDLALAQRRLSGWSTEKQAELLADVQAIALDTDAKRAADVQLLSNALGLGVQPVGPAAPTPAPASGATQLPSGLALLRTVCTAGLWLLLAVGAVALFVFLFRTWRKYQQGAAERSAAGSRGAPDLGPNRTPRSTAEIAEDVKSRWPDDRDLFEDTSPASRGRSVSYTREPEPLEDEPLDVDLPPFMAQRDEPPPIVTRSEPVGIRREPPAEPPKRTPPPAEPAPRQGAALARLGDFTAIYQGESDYDEAFDINDPIDGYMGQCGLQLNDPVGRARDQAVALQVWLWDSSDPDTRVKVLMSEGAYRDTGLRSEQAGEHEALQVRPGTEFTLETHDLLLQGRVERLEYAEQEPYRGVFSELQVKLQALRKS